MNRPSLEMADLVRSAGRNFVERNRSWLHRLHLKVLTAIERCRTAALGGHLDECVRCGHRVISFNSCRNGHCPKCQANARDRWLAARQRELLPTPYVHVVSFCRMNWRHSLYRISEWFTTYSFESVPRHCLRSLAIRSIWARTSVSSVCCIVGPEASNTIPTSTV